MRHKSKLIEELTQQIGFAETIELLRGWGGRRLRVPKTIDEDHPITYSIGLAAALKLARYYGGTELDLPAERNALMGVRNAALVRDMRKGVPTRECARRYGLTPRHARYIRQKFEENEDRAET